MATRFLEQGLDLEQSPYFDKAPFAVDQDGNLEINRGARNKGALSADPGKEPINVNRVIVATGNVTLTAADSGATVIVDTTTSATISLPSTKKGLMFTVSLKQITAGAGHEVDPTAVDKILIGGKADGASYVCSGATDALADFVTVIGDGVDGWYVASQRGTWV